jgi:transposase
MCATTADVTDRNGALEMLKSGAADLTNVKKVLCDGGYSGANFSNSVTAIIPNAKVEVVKRNELHTFAVLPIRWIVERTFGWLDKCRRLWKNCERKLHITLQMHKLALVRLILNRY